MSVLKEILKNTNVQAFLEMIRSCEGTALPNGYRLLFGGKEFPLNNDGSWPDHPHIFFNYKNKAGQVIKTSAAGAYQITHTTWVGLKETLQLTDFSPESQDLCAVELIRESSALGDVMSGGFRTAIRKVRKVWASLPGSGSHQPERTLAEVEKWFEDAGGKIIADGSENCTSERGNDV